MFVFLISMNLIFYASSISDFIINTDKCKMPNFPAFSEETNLTYIAHNYTSCTDLNLLTYTTVENNVAYLHIRRDAIRQYYKSEQEIDCCYSNVLRNGSEEEPDVGISISVCRNFNHSVTLKEDTVIVTCFNKTDIVYENAHRPIVVTDTVRKKLRQAAFKSRPVSILFIVIDSISRLNLIRTMPQTRNFLLENDFIEFVGYNKIDDNTYPNFGALLTGLKLKQSLLKCRPTQVGKLDSCPMIWYDFRKQGYVTAYAEDWAGLATFNYRKKGFKNLPTDFYFKPYIEAAEILKILIEDTMPYCAGPETEGERILSLAKDFAITFKNQPSFGIFWMNTFSHNYINSPTRMDAKVKEFFEDIQRNGIFNESIVVLLSDHGIRFGDIRKTIQGWYEERLPANLLSIPPWFRENYPKKYENIKTNANKLTSTYDLYMTLQEILEMSSLNYTSSVSRACPTCSSLFSKLPEIRSCKAAGIPEEWCTCIGKFEENDSETDYKINNKTIEITLSEIRNIETPVPLSTSVRNILFSGVSKTVSGKQYFLIIFETDALAKYQVLYRIKNKPIEFVRIIKITRIY